MIIEKQTNKQANKRTNEQNKTRQANLKTTRTKTKTKTKKREPTKTHLKGGFHHRPLRVSGVIAMDHPEHCPRRPDDVSQFQPAAVIIPDFPGRSCLLRYKPAKRGAPDLCREQLEPFPSNMFRQVRSSNFGRFFIDLLLFSLLLLCVCFLFFFGFFFLFSICFWFCVRG